MRPFLIALIIACGASSCAAGYTTVDLGTNTACFSIATRTTKVTIPFEIPYSDSSIDSMYVVLSGNMPWGTHSCSVGQNNYDEDCYLATSATFDDLIGVFGEGVFAAVTMSPLGDYSLALRVRARSYTSPAYDFVPGDLDALYGPGRTLTIKVYSMYPDTVYCQHCKPPGGCLDISCELIVYHSSNVGNSNSNWGEIKKLFR